MQSKSILRAALAGSYLLGYLYIQSFFFLFNPQRTYGYWQLAFVLCFLLAGEALARVLARSRSRLPAIAILPPDEVLDHRIAAQAVQGEAASGSPQAPESPMQHTERNFVSATPAPYPKEATFWAACAIGIGVSLALHNFFVHDRPDVWCWNEGFNSGLIIDWGCVALHFIAVYWVLCRFGWLCRRKTGGWLVVDACNALVFFPFGSFFLRAKLFWQGVYHLCKGRLSAKTEKKSAVTTLVILGGFVLLFVLAVNLLRASDSVFNAFWAQLQIGFQWKFSFRWSDYWGRFLFSLPVGAYFFGLFARCMQVRQTLSALERELATPLHAAHQLRVVSPRALTAVLCCFIGLYLLYFGVQAEYYLSAFWGDLPAAFTFSEYARKGFFELCKLMTLNFALLFCVAKVSRVPLRQHKGLRAAGYGLLITSLLFAATALAKLLLYIDAYGFTDLRLLSAWAIAVLVVAVALAVQTLHRAQPVVARLTYFAVGSFTLLCLLGT